VAGLKRSAETMDMRVFPVAAVVVTLAMASCAGSRPGPGYVIPPNLASEVKVGETSRSQVVSLLGRPFQEETGPAGESVFYYDCAKARKSEMRLGVMSTLATIRFDPNGIVKEIENPKFRTEPLTFRTEPLVW
jgi:outer membrane protein assembly factor BamE (lipoprotein component of BamABCDE complex)